MAKPSPGGNDPCGRFSTRVITADLLDRWRQLFKLLINLTPWNLNPVNLCHAKDYLKEQGSGHFC